RLLEPANFRRAAHLEPPFLFPPLLEILFSARNRFCRMPRFGYDSSLAMPTSFIHVKKAITPDGEIENAGILIRDGEIETVARREGLEAPVGAAKLKATDTTAIPGFIDVHIHGAGGRDVMEPDAEALTVVAKNLAEFGTTFFVATTVTAGNDETLRAVESIA